MTQEVFDRQPHPDDGGYPYMIGQIQRRLDDSDRQRAQAIEKQADAYEKAIELQKENQETRIEELATLLSEKIGSGDSELLVRIEAIKEAGDKLANERDRAAEALRTANQKALDQANEEKSKSADRLAEQLREKIESGYENLRQHIRQQAQELEAARRETAIIHEASERAVQKAEAASEKRFEGVNGFREQFNEQSKDFMPRELAETQISEVRKEVTLLRQNQDTSMGKSSGSAATIGYLVAASTLVLGVVVVIVNVLLG